MLYLENAPPVESLINEFNWTDSMLSENARRVSQRRFTAGLRKKWKAWRQRWLPHRKLESILQRVVRSGKLLDIGCGHGGVFDRVPGSFETYGVEIDAAAISAARQQAQKRGGDVIHCSALQGLTRLAGTGMDAIIMHSYLEHEVEPLAVLQAASRVLSERGCLIIKVPNYACWNRYLQGERWPGFRYPDHVNYFTPETLQSMIRQAGLEVRRFGRRDRLPTSDNMWLLAGKARASVRQAGSLWDSLARQQREEMTTELLAMSIPGREGGE